MKKRLVKRILLTLNLLMIAAIGVTALLIASVKHHRIMVLAATSEHSVKERGEQSFINAYILTNSGESISFLASDGRHEMKLASKIDDVSGQVADIDSIGGLVTAITVKTSKITGSVVSVSDDGIEIKEYGRIKAAENFSIIVTEDEAELKTNKEILLGYESADFIISDDMLQAAFPKNRIADNVKVILNTTGYGSLYHDEVKISANSDFTAEYSDGRPFGEGSVGSGSYGKDEEICFDQDCIKNGESIVIKCDRGRIGVLSIQRNKSAPYYRGTITVNRTDKGYTIINELPVESYLYGVVPSEMPASYPQEALKAQAICARSFIYKQMTGSSYESLGADVDDSTNCQVYNNQEENESVIKAVDETCGQVLMGGGEILKTYYYSTSCGSGAGIDEVWAGDESTFYSSELYLSDDGLSDESKEVFAAADDGFSLDKLSKKPLSDEEIFRDFIDAECITYAYKDVTLRETVKTYDSGFGWYRWTVDASIDAYSKSVNERLSATASSFPGKVLVLSDGKYVEKSINSLGKIKGIEVAKRGKSGIVTELIIKGSDNTVKVIMQSAIRQLLAPKGLTVKLADGSENTGMSLLPSAFFYADVKDGRIILNGGGYGHGVGLSQNGAKAMADEGLGCEEILMEYFPGSSVYSV